jgi:hypothetical protein
VWEDESHCKPADIANFRREQQAKVCGSSDAANNIIARNTQSASPHPTPTDCQPTLSLSTGCNSPRYSDSCQQWRECTAFNAAGMMQSGQEASPLNSARAPLLTPTGLRPNATGRVLSHAEVS